MSNTAGGTTRDDTDQIVRDLRALRVSAGGVTYAEIVRRVTALRSAAGDSEALARPARTTVYDAFREGRARLDPDLVGDIAQVLGADGQAFRERCLRARLATETAVTVPDPAPAASDEPSSGDGTGDSPPDASPRVGEASTEHARRPPALMLMLGCLTLNLLGYLVVALFGLPMFLDMTGTGIAAIALGPWHGVAVAVATHVVGTSVHGAMTVPFMVVNIVGALLWGYGVRRFKMGDSLPRFFALTLGVAVACSAVATPILLLLFDGATGHSSALVGSLVDLGEPFALAVLHANLMISAADKLLSGFIILTAVAALTRVVPVPGGAVFVALGTLRPARHSTSEPAVSSEHDRARAV